MAHILLNCPHCRGDHVGFTSVAEYKFQRYQHRWLVFFVCNNCERGVLIEYEKAGAPSPASSKTDPTTAGAHQSASYPERIAIAVPDAAPRRNHIGAHRPRLRVLLVEDEAMVAMLVEDMLEGGLSAKWLFCTGSSDNPAPVGAAAIPHSLPSTSA